MCEAEGIPAAEKIGEGACPKREEETKQHSEVTAEKIIEKKERICEDGEETRR